MLTVSAYPNMNNYSVQKPIKNPQVSFNGHLQCSYARVNGVKKRLINETAVFREVGTLEKIAECIKQLPKDQPKKIVVGACSSGEEAFSMGMLLDGTNSSILGFDLSPKMIEQAKNGIVSIKSPANEQTRYMNSGVHAYKDEYLGFSELVKNKDQKERKALFDSFFEELPLRKFKLRDLFSFILPFSEYHCFSIKNYKLKNNALTNCHFKEGNILNMKDVAEPNSADAFLFRNAMYHLVTYSPEAYERESLPPERALPIFERIVKNVNRTLKKGGIFAFGEREANQATDVGLLETVLQKCGFSCMDEGGKTRNIWKKVKDIPIEEQNL